VHPRRGCAQWGVGSRAPQEGVRPKRGRQGAFSSTLVRKGEVLSLISVGAAHPASRFGGVTSRPTLSLVM
ncbi:unnamed protein product, partial [Musa textilis]